MKSIKIFLICFLSFLFIMSSSLFLFIMYHKKQPQIPVLMYHQILPKKMITKGLTDTITVEAFEQQMKYLKDHGYQSISLDDFYAWRKSKKKLSKKSVLITFDDGFSSVYYYARPIMEKYQMQGSVFLIGHVVPDKTAPYTPGRYNLIGEDIIHQSDNILEYASHSFHMHEQKNGKPKIYSMSKEDLIKDIQANKRFKIKPYMTYPYNTDTSQMHQALKQEQIKLAFYGEDEKATKKGSDYQIPRIGVNGNFERFRSIFETEQFNNRYGNGLMRKIFITIERKLHIRIG